MLPEQVEEFKLRFGRLIRGAELRGDRAALTERLRALLTEFDLPTTRENLVKRKKRCRTKPVPIADGSWSNGGWGADGAYCFYKIGWCPTLNALLLRDEFMTGEDTYWRIPSQERKGTHVFSLSSLADFIERVWRLGIELMDEGTRPPPRPFTFDS